MNKMIEVIYDGEVFRPTSPPNLEPNTHGQVVIVPDAPNPMSENAWDVLDELAGSIAAPPDWSSNHDHYLYGPGRNWNNPNP